MQRTQDLGRQISDLRRELEIAEKALSDASVPLSLSKTIQGSLDLAVANVPSAPRLTVEQGGYASPKIAEGLKSRLKLAMSIRPDPVSGQPMPLHLHEDGVAGPVSIPQNDVETLWS